MTGCTSLCLVLQRAGTLEERLVRSLGLAGVLSLLVVASSTIGNEELVLDGHC